MITTGEAQTFAVAAVCKHQPQSGTPIPSFAIMSATRAIRSRNSNGTNGI